MPRRNYKRRIKLIDPRLQLKLTLTFAGLMCLSLLLQYMLFTNTLSDLALSLPHDGMLVMDEAPRQVAQDLAFSFLVLMPLTLAVGVLSTFRIAGPLYRFREFLSQVVRGESPADFQLRKGDELNELADLIRDATRPLRSQSGRGVATDASESNAAPPSLIASARGERVDAAHTDKTP